MCGRAYATYTGEELYFRYLNRKTWPWRVAETMPPCEPNYNMCPTQHGMVLGVFDGKLEFRLMRWGLVPAWAKSIEAAERYSMINAKSEEIAEKPSYTLAFRRRRCIVPVSGFYEWKRSGRTKRPYAIVRADQSIMSLAGIWESWSGGETKEVVLSYAIITTAANAYMSEIHTRMPLILNEESERTWLDPGLTDPAQIRPLMQTSAGDALTCYEVSPLVNSPKNNSPEVLQRVERPA